jgi:hypothetical protein
MARIEAERPSDWPISSEAGLVEGALMRRAGASWAMTGDVLIAQSTATNDHRRNRIGVEPIIRDRLGKMSDSSDARCSQSIKWDGSEHVLCIIFKGFRQRQKSCPFESIKKNAWSQDRASPVRRQGHHWPTHLNVSFMTFGVIELQPLETRLMMFTAKNAFLQI